MNSDGLDLRRARRALNELVRRSTSVGVRREAEGVFGRITRRIKIKKKKGVHQRILCFAWVKNRIDVPPSRNRYMLRLSAFSRIRSPSSLSLPATSRVTARTTSSVRPCRTRLCARLDEGSGVRIDGNEKGFFFG